MRSIFICYFHLFSQFHYPTFISIFSACRAFLVTLSIKLTKTSLFFPWRKHDYSSRSLSLCLPLCGSSAHSARSIRPLWWTFIEFAVVNFDLNETEMSYLQVWNLLCYPSHPICCVIPHTQFVVLPHHTQFVVLPLTPNLLCYPSHPICCVTPHTQFVVLLLTPNLLCYPSLPICCVTPHTQFTSIPYFYLIFVLSDSGCGWSIWLPKRESLT